jgi:hypothetical protein
MEVRMTTVRARDVKIRSSLVRRLVHASDDPVKRRASAWLCTLSDEQLSSSLGLTAEDIAALRAIQALQSFQHTQTPLD